MGGNLGVGEHLHLPDSMSIAGSADTLCYMYLTPPVALLFRETAGMALEMLHW